MAFFSWLGVTENVPNGFYAGLIQYAGEEVVEEEGDHDPIVTRKVYEEAQLRLLQLRPGPAA